ncbi:MAG: hypothetical protein ABI232_09845 [Jatrophihabitantaceae bacterium]
MNTRATLAGLALSITLAAGLVAGCSSSSNKPTPNTSGAPVPSTSAAPSATELAAMMTTALQSLTSAHVDVDAGVLGGTSTADVKLSDGVTQATDVKLNQSGQDIEVITADGKSYAKVSGTSKPWTLVSPTSSNPVVKSFASSINVAGIVTELASIVKLIGTGTDVHSLGTDQVRDAPAAHYSMTINPQSGGGDPALGQVLASLGNTPLPIQLWLDAQSRPVKVSLAIPLGAKPITISATISDFDAALTITAPPADQVSTD